MMATVCPSDFSLAPLLETLEDSSASQAEQTDAYLTIANRLSGEDGKEFTTVVGMQFPRICKVFKEHVSGQNSELSCAALQALGFSVFHRNIAEGLAATDVEELLSTLCTAAVKSSDKNTCTRALWVISKQNFPPETIGKMVPNILSTIETVLKGDVQSLVIEYEALNVIVRLLEQTPTQMEEDAARWSTLIIPLVINSAPKVRLRAATALEMGMPLLLQKQQEVAALTEQLMNAKLISELQKLFSAKNETYVLKLWPLFVKLLGKSLHRGGSFINSLLHLEELGFRSGSPVVKKIAFIAWKSLIDNFALNPDILCSTKRLKLLMQPLSSIHVRTEALALTKLEVWWYLVIKLGVQLPSNFEQVCIPLLQNTLASDPSGVPPGTPSRTMANQSINPPNSAQKPGSFPFGSPTTPRINLNSSLASGTSIIPAIQLLGIEMLLHFLLGPEVAAFAVQHKLILSLEPLQYPLISSPSFFSKNASTLLNAVRDGFIAVGKDASDAMLNRIWKDLISFVKTAIETGSKKERQGSEMLTLVLQTLQHIIISDGLPAAKSMALLEATVKGLPQKVLGSAVYQVANMDILNGTPALFLIQLLFHGSLLECCISEERFFLNLETLVGYVLSGPTSPLAFSESVLNVINQSSRLLDNKEHLWRMWSIIVNALTERINQTNEVNQGDALEHNFSAMYSALTLPICHLFPVKGFPQPTMKSLLRTWSEMYRAFARCASLVVTAEENVCCEELCAKILPSLEDEVLSSLSTLEGVVVIITVMVDCINFSPYSSKFQPKTKTPPTPTTNWSKKKHEPLGNLTSLLKLLVRSLNSFHVLSSKESQLETPVSSMSAIGISIIGVIHNIFSHLSLPSVIHTMLANLTRPLATFYEKSSKSPGDVPKVYSTLGSKLEKLLGEILLCLQSHCTASYNSDLLEQLSPLLCAVFLHKNKQIHTQVSQFWNATFGKAASLEYTEQLKPILNKVKQKTPLLLPGFESIAVSEESSGPYVDASENSQLSTKISGIEVKSSGKRDSLLSRAEELKEKGTPTRATPAKLKLDFSSPKRACRELLLEEEKSVDFIFIPPEPKERVLTEHQKEVLRTKRVDIPAMYNNLDASQDTTLFTQYSQTPEETTDKPFSGMEEVNEKMIKVQKDSKDLDDGTDAEITAKVGDSPEQSTEVKSTNETISNSKEDPNEVLCDDTEKTDDCLVDPASAGGETVVQEDSANLSSSSASSDIISGTPQKPVSRRQSFITLEKFDSSENRSFSPSALSKLGACVSKILTPGQETIKIEDLQKNEADKFEEKSLSSSQAELKSSSVSGQKKSTRKKNRTDQTEIKQSKLSRCSKPEKSLPEPMDVSTAEETEFDDSKKSRSELTETIFIPDTPAQVVEMSVTEQSLNTKSVVESDAVTAMESKENTPPEGMCSDSANIGDGVASQAPVNQKTLRRSSRKRSEGTGMTTDSQDKEEVVSQKENDKDKDKSHQKMSYTDQDLVEGQKILYEKTVAGQTEVKDRKNLTEKNITKAEKVQKKALQADDEMRGSYKKSGEDNSVVDDASDSNSEKGSQEAARGRSRYHTRRASQGLLASIENSESDNSETREEGQRRKRPAKNRSVKTVEFPEKKETNEEAENCPKGSSPPEQNNLEVKSTVHLNESKLVPDDLKTPDVKNYTIIQDSVDNLNSAKTDEQSGAMGQIDKPDIVTESTFIVSQATEPHLKPRQVNKTYTITQGTSELPVMEPSLITESELEEYSTAVSDVFFSSDKSLQVTECLHKRSKRIRKSKNCDCCTLTLQQQEKPYTELKDVDKAPVKREDMKQPILQINTAVSSETNFDENIISGPCAVSTPRFANKELLIFKPSVSELESGSDIEEDKTTLSVKVNFEDKIKQDFSKLEAEDAIVSAEEPMEENGTTAEQTEITEVVLQSAEENSSTDEHTVIIEKVLHTTEETCNTAEHTVIKEKVPQPTEETGNTAEHSAIEENVPHPMEENGSAVAHTLIREKVLEEPIEESRNLVVENGHVLATDDQQRTNQSGSKELISFGEVTAKKLEETGTAEVQENAEELSQATQIEDNCSSNDDKIGEPETSTENVPISIKPEEVFSSELPKETINVESPQKLKGLDSAALVVDNQSPSGMQPRCVWSPSASPSTSILKKGVKRPSENDSPSPVNKIRRVSFADPIYQEGLADDIDRRSPVVRSHASSNSSPASKVPKASSNTQSKLLATPTKGFLSPGSRSPGIKSSKKCLISEMSKQPLSSKDSVYPALVGCAAPVDMILPQITSNMWARGLGQLVRAKNIKTVGDLSVLTAAEIKTLPIRSPKVLTVKMALKQYHEQQKKSQGFEEITTLDENEKPLNGIDDKLCSSNCDEEKLAADLAEATPAEKTSTDLLTDISALNVRLTPEELNRYSGSQLFAMQEKLSAMVNSIMGTLQSRWNSPPHEGSV